ncbi:unnamed protein product [Allacma fusca]|uniref:Uncharacterized protein n=2 Tax=Allacma fusca TaxID=39272 RepID=A0A8J2P435_9HEXA|nr:unnamed protein product [Allacma fusca]
MGRPGKTSFTLNTIGTRQNDNGNEYIFCEDNYVRTKRYIMQIEERNNSIIDIWRLSSRLFDINCQIERMVLNLKAHFKILDAVIRKAKNYYSHPSELLPRDSLKDVISVEFNDANENYQVFAQQTSISFTNVCDGCSDQSAPENCFSYSYSEFVKILFELSFCKSEALDCIAKSERYFQSLQSVLEMMR